MQGHSPIAGLLFHHCIVRLKLYTANFEYTIPKYYLIQRGAYGTKEFIKNSLHLSPGSRLGKNTIDKIYWLR